MTTGKLDGPCPVCDLNRVNLSPTEAFLLGVGIGEAIARDTIKDGLCERHRGEYARDICAVAMKIGGTP